MEKTLASSGAAVICGGTPLVIENLLGHSEAYNSHISKVSGLCAITSFYYLYSMCFFILISVQVAGRNKIKLVL